MLSRVIAQDVGDVFFETQCRDINHISQRAHQARRRAQLHANRSCCFCNEHYIGSSLTVH